MNPLVGLNRLSARAGIASEYQDAWGRSHNVGEDTKSALLAALGIACASQDEVHSALEVLASQEWRRPLPPVLVLRQSELLRRASFIPLVLPKPRRSQRLTWTLTLEDGTATSGKMGSDSLRRIDERRLGHGSFVRLALPLPAELPLGYHRFELAYAGTAHVAIAAMCLIVVPARCYEPPALSGGGRIWGIQVQLYSLRSERNWGMGDFTDLRHLLESAAQAGAGAVGLNPLHALFPDNPEHASPYGPSSRGHWNTLYLDVEAVPDFAECDAARSLVGAAEFQSTLCALRSAELVDYEGVAAAKGRVLELLFENFHRRHLETNSRRGRAFAAYCADSGSSLEALARFEALQEHFHRADPSVWGWPVWPPAYRDPDAAAVTEFCRAHAYRVQFRQYLQWEAERQLAGIGRRSWELGLGVGLYLDLAVGVDRGGAEVWAERWLYVLDAGIGAPPDGINQQGQDWGLPPIHPQCLFEAAYAPFVALLSANMRHAGGLRIDHVMGLMRQFWVPQGQQPAAGAYVAYPFSDLLGILALESRRNQCLVIGEDLGTVPDEVRRALAELGVYSCQPLELERDSSGGFSPPAEYPQRALVSIGTHDLPTLRGYWRGHDLETRASLDLFPSAEVRQSQVLGRAGQRARLLIALEREGLLPQGLGVDPLTVPDVTAQLCNAVHLYLARSRAQIMMVAPEDVMGEIGQMNLPGTTAADHPNWRRKLPVELKGWRDDPSSQALVEALNRARGAAVYPRVAPEAGSGCIAQARIPLATYRIQMHRGFTLAQATDLVAYWHELGISHCYTSPYLRARPNSNHGYDITDHGSINPEVGSSEDLQRFVAALKARGMGQIIDVVPNHMGVLGGDNAWWQDVLENGQASAYASYFDIEWQPLKEELRGKLLLPVLGDQYGRVLERGELKLVFDAQRGELCLHYYQHRFPIDPRQYPRVLGCGVERLVARLGEEQPAHLELQSLITAFGHLPAHHETAPQQVAERGRDKEIHKRRLADLAGRCADVALFLEENVAAHNGTPGDPQSWDALHALIKEQPWRLAYWRVAADEINYRRFFDNNDLAALRMESEPVFRATHRLIIEWLAAGWVDGLRVDHPDGLYDPSQYLERLQSSTADSGAASPLYVVVEKILAGHERLPQRWPIFGTTGYTFAKAVNDLLVDADNERSIERIYAAFIGEKQDFAEIVYRSKKLIMRSAMAGELHVLASQLSRIALASRNTCDFTVNSLRDALGEIVACFPVYRTYVTPESSSEDDRRYIDWAVALAKKRSPAADLSVFDFVREVLTGAAATGRQPEEAQHVFAFAMRFQQYTAPVMAKGVEDTAFYIYNRLVSLNDVGSDPRTFGASVSAFHRANQERALRWPHTMLASSTHDSKRSEDVRARIDVLSEIPLEWLRRLRRWRRLNRSNKRLVDGAPAPSRHDEYLLYQTLLGIWPLEPQDAAGLALLQERVAASMLKAVREAKLMTSWLNPHGEYEEALAAFVASLLAGTSKNRFLADFLPFQQRVARFGLFNSLSQTLLKFASPGVPDLYQGNELWRFNLVDPDNRQPVDYALRQALLGEIVRAGALPGAKLANWARGLLETMEDGRVILYLTWRCLNVRRRLPALFQGGIYLPLRITGACAEHVCAFARRSERQAAIVIAPRLFVRLMGEAALPLGAVVWQDTCVELPADLAGMGLTNALTGESCPLQHQNGKTSLPLAAALAQFPVALYCERT